LFDGEGCPKGGVRPPDTTGGEIVRGSFSPRSGRHLGRWGTVRLRMTLWNVAVLALILGAMGGVVRYIVQADLFATVDRTLAERAHSVFLRGGAPLAPGPPPLSRGRARLLDPIRLDVRAEGSLVGSTKPGALPPLPPRIIPRDPWRRPSWDQEPW